MILACASIPEVQDSSAQLSRLWASSSPCPHPTAAPSRPPDPEVSPLPISCSLVLFLHVAPPASEGTPCRHGSRAISVSNIGFITHIPPVIVTKGSSALWSSHLDITTSACFSHHYTHIATVLHNHDDCYCRCHQRSSLRLCL